SHSIQRSMKWLRSRRSRRSSTPPPASRPVPTASVPPLSVEPAYQTPTPDYLRPRRSRFKRYLLIFIAVFVLYQILRSRDRGPVSITWPDGNKVHVGKDKGVQWDPAVPDAARKAAETYVKKNYPSHGVLKGRSLIDPNHAVFSGHVDDGPRSKRFHIYFHLPAKKTHWEFERIEFEKDEAADGDADDS